MKAKWLISNLGKDVQIQALNYAVQETGRESKIITLGDIAEMIETESQEKDCVVVCGSIWGNKALQQARPSWIGNFHNKKQFCCSSYYSYWGKYLTQQHYCMLPLSEVIRKKDWLYETFGKDGLVFIRPDSGEKEFNGELVHKEMFNYWQECVFNNPESTPDIICVVAKPVEILKEIRFVIADNKVVTGSFYRIAKHLHYASLDEDSWTECLDFINAILAENVHKLPPYFVLDIAIEPDKMSILEAGCFCCAGLYECDRKKIAESISISAENYFMRKEASLELQAEKRE